MTFFHTENKKYSNFNAKSSFRPKTTDEYNLHKHFNPLFVSLVWAASTPKANMAHVYVWDPNIEHIKEQSSRTKKILKMSSLCLLRTNKSETHRANWPCLFTRSVSATHTSKYALKLSKMLQTTAHK